MAARRRWARYGLLGPLQKEGQRLRDDLYLAVTLMLASGSDMSRQLPPVRGFFTQFWGGVATFPGMFLANYKFLQPNSISGWGSTKKGHAVLVFRLFYLFAMISLSVAAPTTTTERRESCLSILLAPKAEGPGQTGFRGPATRSRAKLSQPKCATASVPALSRDRHGSHSQVASGGGFTAQMGPQGGSWTGCRTGGSISGGGGASGIAVWLGDGVSGRAAARALPFC